MNAQQFAFCVEQMRRRDDAFRYGRDYARVLDIAGGALTTAEALKRSQPLRDVSPYLEEAKKRIAYVAGCTPLPGNIQERLQSLRERLEKMQQGKEGMDSFEATRLLQRARADRESARGLRKAKRFREAMDFAQRSTDAQRRVERECSSYTIEALGKLYRNARHNNPKLMQSILDEQQAHGYAPSMRQVPAAPQVPTRTINRTTGGNSPMLNVTTTTVQVIDGHVGQVWLNGEIVWQSKPVAKPDTNKKGHVVRSAASKANELAVKRVNSKFKDLLAG